MARHTISTISSLLLVVFVAFLASSISAASLPNADDWTNTNYVKQLDLAGSTSYGLTTLTVKPKSIPAGATSLPYYFALSSDEADQLSWSRLTVKPALDSVLASTSELRGGARPVLELEPQGVVDRDVAKTVLYKAEIPTNVIGAEGVSLTLETALNHVTSPLPSTVKQTDPQLFLWTGDATIRSPYTTSSGRIKIKAATPKILSFTPQDATKSGSIITFGPFTNLAPQQLPAQGSVHYQSDTPRATIVTLDRVAEISHWGDALSITDRILLRNSGPSLKGHFSRIEHQMASFYNRGSGSALSSLSFTLPAGSKNPWFIDQIGNVSTSRFRPTPPDAGLVGKNGKGSLLELQPRFPLLGGWNYTFSIGYTLPLSAGGWTKHLFSSDDYVTAIPLFTPLKDVAVDQLSTTIVLPEGATRVQLELPFEMDTVDNGITKTYLDTVGRPTIRVDRKKCSAEHAQLVYVKYTLTHRANMIKVVAVAGVTALLLGATAVVQRLETKIR